MGIITLRLMEITIHILKIEQIVTQKMELKNYHTNCYFHENINVFNSCKLLCKTGYETIDENFVIIFYSLTYIKNITIQ